ncbi:MAG: response regulator transcription factor [Rhodospirillaceae bacterium]|nr:response regulator transcription factor [Rhodospirillaceae bacterium]
MGKIPHLLIVEDDELVQSLMGAYLQRDGFTISLAATGKEMLAAIDTEHIDLVLLDLGLPDEDGLSLARQVRARSDLPIIVITARKVKSDRLAALEVGADDYLTKPFDPDELVLRVRNILGRAGTVEAPSIRSEIYRFEGWSLDMDARAVIAPDGEHVAFTRAELNLLAALVKAPNRVLTRAHLLDAVSHDAASPTDRLIDVLVSRIRKKIEPEPKAPQFITTVVGCGYKFSRPVT